MKTLLRSFTVLLVVLVFSVGFALTTNQGLHWMIAGLTRVVPGKLVVEQSRGSVAGPIALARINYQTPDLQLHIDRLELDWRLRELFLLRFHITKLVTSGVAVRQLSRQESTHSDQTFALDRLPVDVLVDELAFSGINIYSYGKEAPLQVTGITLQAALTRHHIDVRRFAVDAPEFALQLQGRLGIDGQDADKEKMQVSWWAQPAELPRITGVGKFTGNLQQLQFEQRITAPFIFQLTGSAQDIPDRLSWKANAKLQEVLLQDLRPEWPNRTVSATLHSSGTIDNFVTNGALKLSDGDLDLLTGDFQLFKDRERWRLSQLELHSPQLDGTVSVAGEYDAGTEPAQISANAQWSDFVWPLSEDRNLRSRQGAIGVEGVLTDYRFRGSGDLELTGIPHVKFQTQGHGGTDRVELTAFHAELPEGNVGVDGFLQWVPQLQWEVAVTGNGVNPNWIAPDWSGSLTFTAHSKGMQSADGVIADVAVDGLSGSLQGQPVKGRLRGRLAGKNMEIPELELSVGPAQLTAAGAIGDKLDFQWQVSVDHLGLLVPNGSGALHAKGKLSGPRDRPAVTALVDGQGLRYRQYKIGQLKVNADLDLQDRRVSRLLLTGTGIESEGREIGAVNLRANGRLFKHTLDLSWVRIDSQLHASASGGWETSRWTGVVNSIDIATKKLHNWALEQPVSLVLAKESAHLPPLCLTDSIAKICLHGVRHDSGAWQGRIDLAHIPLAMMKPFIQEQLSVEGAVNANVQLGYQPGDGLRGDAKVEVTPGRIDIRDGQESIPVTQFGSGSLTAVLDPAQLNAQFQLPLSEAGFIKGNVNLTNLGPPGGVIHPKTSIQSQWQMHFKDQGLVSLLSPGISGTAGQVDMDLSIAGPAQAPVVKGNALLKDGDLSIAMLGIRLQQLQIDAAGKENGDIGFSASAISGEGTATVSGQFNLATGDALAADVTLAGKDFEISNLPEARIFASPDLKLQVRGRRVDVSGEIDLPVAEIHMKEITGTVSESDDLVIVNQAGAPNRQDKWRIHSNVSLALGNKVKFEGFNLSGGMQGKLQIVDEPEQPTVGHGELKITNGQYKMYGQKLKIDRGRMIFAGGPIGNPGLDIRAVRKTGDVLAGVRIAGTASDPALNLFSEPGMDESNVLSYLLFGRPMAQASQEQGAMLAGAAGSMGLAGGDLLARKLGKAFGLEEVRIESGNTMEESSMVLGKYLAPRIYISYAVGLFDHLSTFRMRYELTRKWTVQSETGVATGADLLYSIER